MWPSRSNTIHFPSGDKSRAIHVPSLVSKSISRVAPLALVVSHSAADFSCASSSAPLVNKATRKVRTSFVQLAIRQSMSRLSCGRINLPFRLKSAALGHRPSSPCAICTKKRGRKSTRIHSLVLAQEQISKIDSQAHLNPARARGSIGRNQLRVDDAEIRGIRQIERWIEEIDVVEEVEKVSGKLDAHLFGHMRDFPEPHVQVPEWQPAKSA